MSKFITVEVAGNREIRQENRKLRRKLRKRRRNERLNRRQDRLQNKLKDDSPRGRRAARRQGGRATPEPAPSPRHTRPQRPPRRASEPETWDEPAEEVEEVEEVEDEPVRPRRRLFRRAPVEDEELEDESLEDEEFEDEEFGGLPAKGARVDLASIQNGLPIQGSLKVGKLRVLAPRGERGLVLPLGSNVYLVSHWPQADMKAHGTQTLGQVMLEVAKARLLASAKVGDEVGILPLALLLLKQRQNVQAAQQLQPPAPVPTVAGACNCQRRW